MLDFFLILGQIPGTNLQLTFSEFLLALLILAPVIAWYDLDRAKRVRASVIQLSSLHSFSYPLDSSVPELQTRRTIVNPQASSFWQSLVQAWQQVRRAAFDN